MEKFLLHCAKIVGTPTETSGSWVHTFSPQEEEKLQKRGHLLAVIGLTEFSGSQDLAAIGKELISRLHEEYYGDLMASPFDQLQNTISKVSKEVKEGAEFKLDIGTVGVVGKILYALVNNGGRLIINRDGQITPLLSETEILSGYLHEDDVFLLGTGEFFRLVNEEVLNLALKAATPEEAVEILAPAVHGQPDGGSAAIVFQVIKQEEEPKKEPAFSPPEATLHLTQGKLKISKLVFHKLKIKIGDLVSLIDEKIKKRIIFLKSNREKPHRSQKTLISVALILLAILATSVFFGMRQRKNLGVNNQTSALLNQAQAKKEEAQGLVSLNPAKSRQLLLEAQNLINQAEGLGNKSEELIRFKTELAPLLSSVLQEHQVEGTQFFDLGIIKDGALGSSFILNNDQLIVLDKNQNSIYQVGVKDKKNTILGGGEKIAGANLITDLNNNFYVLASEGIFRLTKSPELILKKDTTWGEIKSLVSFSDSFYLLDGQGEIWKYPMADSTLGTKQKWLTQTTDFSQAKEMMIDGSIWVLDNSGQISKFTRGVKDNLSITGLNKPLSQVVAFYTNADIKNLYLLDKGNSRVVVLSKAGEYQSEFSWSGIAEANDLVVTSDESQLFLLSGSKINTINLK